MKKLIGLALVLTMVMSFYVTAYAADAGVQVIGGNDTSMAEPVSLDDLKLNVTVDLPGYGKIAATAFSFQNELDYYAWKLGDNDTRTYKTGNDADYAILYFTILNTKTTDLNFMSDISEVIATFDDVYQYSGFWMQLDPRRNSPTIPVHDDFIYSLAPMYEGGFIIGVTLPNAVVNSKAPLSLTFKLGENEVTYNIRK